MKHTTEPWHVCEPTEALHAVRAEAGRIVADVGYSDTDAQNRMNARRIVACVNACAGVTTEELEQGGFVTGLVEQRDELHAALKRVAAADLLDHSLAPERSALAIARDVLAKVGAGNTANGAQ